MTNNTTADTAASGAGEGGSLVQRLRDEGDYSDCKYQCERLHGFADEVDTLRAQLEAAEAEIAFARETISKSLDTEIDAGERLRTLAIRASNAIYWRDQEIQEWKARAEAAEAEAVRMRPALALCLKELRAMRVACGAGVMTDVAIFSAEAALAARTKAATP